MMVSAVMMVRVASSEALASRRASGTLVYRHIPRYTPIRKNTAVFVASRNGNKVAMRWIERVGGLDIDAPRARLDQSLARGAAAAASLDAARYFIVVDGVAFLVRDGAVVTCFPDIDNDTRLHLDFLRKDVARPPVERAT